MVEGRKIQGSLHRVADRTKGDPYAPRGPGRVPTGCRPSPSPTSRPDVTCVGLHSQEKEETPVGEEGLERTWKTHEVLRAGARGLRRGKRFAPTPLRPKCRHTVLWQGSPSRRLDSECLGPSAIASPGTPGPLEPLVPSLGETKPNPRSFGSGPAARGPGAVEREGEGAGRPWRTGRFGVYAHKQGLLKAAAERDSYEPPPRPDPRPSRSLSRRGRRNSIAQGCPLPGEPEGPRGVHPRPAPRGPSPGPRPPGSDRAAVECRGDRGGAARRWGPRGPPRIQTRAGLLGRPRLAPPRALVVRPFLPGWGPRPD